MDAGLGSGSRAYSIVNFSVNLKQTAFSNRVRLSFHVIDCRKNSRCKRLSETRDNTLDLIPIQRLHCIKIFLAHVLFLRLL